MPASEDTILGGDGIHDRVSRKLLNPDGTPKLFFGQYEYSFWDQVRDIMAECRGDLLRAGYPDPEESLLYVVGVGWMPRAKEPTTEQERKIHSITARVEGVGKPLWESLGKPGFGTGSGSHYAQVAAPIFSNEWYAGEIYQLCALINDNRDSTYDGHLFRIFEIAALLKDREWRKQFGLMIKRDIKGQKGRRDGAAIRRGQTKGRSGRIIQEIRALKERRKLSTASAARIVFSKGHGTSAEANRALWQRHAKKSKPTK